MAGKAAFVVLALQMVLASAYDLSGIRVDGNRLVNHANQTVILKVHKITVNISFFFFFLHAGSASYNNVLVIKKKSSEHSIDDRAKTTGILQENVYQLHSSKGLLILLTPCANEISRA